MSQCSSIKSISVRHSLKHPLLVETRPSCTKNSLRPTPFNNTAINHSFSTLSSRPQERKSCNHSRCQSVSHSTSRIFKPEERSQRYMKKKIDRMFNKCEQEMQTGEVFNEKNVLEVFVSLGFFSDPPTDKDLACCRLIMGLLQRQKRGVSRSNLLRLIYIIINIPSQLDISAADHPCSGLQRDTDESFKDEQAITVGYFDNSGAWVTTQKQQNIVRSKLGYLYYNRISSERMKQSKASFQQQNLFRPKIGSNSSRISLNHRRRMSSTSNINTKNLQQRQQFYKKKHEQWLEGQLQARANKQMQSCSFKPQINKSTIRTNCSISQLKKESDRQNLTSLQKKQREQLKECSFKPRVSAYKQNAPVAIVKNSSKAVSRLQEAYKKRVAINICRQRGYPKQFKCQGAANSTRKEVPEKSPILTINIRIKDSLQALDIYEGEMFQNLVCKILVKNKLPYEYIEKVESMLQEIIERSETACLKKGFVCAR